MDAKDMQRYKVQGVEHMGIRLNLNVHAKSDMSYLFSSLGRSASNVASSDFLGQYASIKNGSYGKLMKAYYGKNASDSVKKLAQNTDTKKNVTTEDKTNIAKMQTTTDALKESADALLANGSKSLFQQVDVTTKDENGVETTAKGYDTDAIYNALNSFVLRYNAVIDAAGNISDKSLTGRIDSMTGATVSNYKLLSKVGITVGENGKLSISKDAFSKADMNTVKNLFHGSGSYAYQISAQSSMINFAADRLADRNNTYTVGGTYNRTLNLGSIYNNYR